MIHQEKLRYWVAPLVFITLGFLLYAKVLNGEFVSDDYGNIVDNPAVRDLGNLPAIWQAFNTRFMVGLSFALNYRLGGLDVWGYHLVNIAVHLLVVFQVFSFVSVLFETPVLRKSPLYADRRLLAFYAALIFLCHPVQTQAVAFITQREALVAVIFYLTTVIFYLKWRVTGRQRYGWGAGVILLAGLFSKEMIVTVPAALTACEFFFFSGQGVSWRKRILSLAPFYVLTALLPILLFFDRPHSVLSLGEQVRTSWFNPQIFFAELNALCTYVRLVFVPVNLHHLYDYPIPAHLWSWPTPLAILVLTAIGGLAWLLFCRQRLMSFAITWFFLTVSVETAAMCLVNRGVMFEHWLYLPMVGFAIFAVMGLYLFFSDRAAFQRAGAMVVVILSLLTFMRNDVWRTEIGFWQDNVRKTPNLSMAYYGLGCAFQRRRSDGFAREVYQQPLRECSRWGSQIPERTREMCAGLYSNLGIISSRHGDDRKALEYFILAVGTDPANAQARNNLAKSYFDLGKFPEAISEYHQSLALQMDYPDAHFYLGQALWSLGDKAEADKEFQKAVALYRQFGLPEDVEMVRQKMRELQDQQP